MVEKFFKNSKIWSMPNTNKFFMGSTGNSYASYTCVFRLASGKEAETVYYNTPQAHCVTNVLQLQYLHPKGSNDSDAELKS